MKSFEIEIRFYGAGGIYSAKNIEETRKIAQSECDSIYDRLGGKCGVEIVNIEEIKQ